MSQFEAAFNNLVPHIICHWKFSNNSNTHRSFDMELKIEISKTNYTRNYNILKIEQILKPFEDHLHHHDVLLVVDFIRLFGY